MITFLSLALPVMRVCSAMQTRQKPVNQQEATGSAAHEYGWSDSCKDILGTA